MKVRILLENAGDNRMLGVSDNVLELEALVTAVIVRKEVVPIQVAPYIPGTNTPFADKAYIELEFEKLRPTKIRDEVKELTIGDI